MRMGEPGKGGRERMSHFIKLMIIGVLTVLAQALSQEDEK